MSYEQGHDEDSLSAGRDIQSDILKLLRESMEMAIVIVREFLLECPGEFYFQVLFHNQDIR